MKNCLVFKQKCEKYFIEDTNPVDKIKSFSIFYFIDESMWYKKIEKYLKIWKILKYGKFGLYKFYFEFFY